jgi:hypothetical protein
VRGFPGKKSRRSSGRRSGKTANAGVVITRKLAENMTRSVSQKREQRPSEAQANEPRNCSPLKCLARFHNGKLIGRDVSWVPGFPEKQCPWEARGRSGARANAGVGVRKARGPRARHETFRQTGKVPSGTGCIQLWLGSFTGPKTGVSRAENLRKFASVSTIQDYELTTNSGHVFGRDASLLRVIRGPTAERPAFQSSDRSASSCPRQPCTASRGKVPRHLLDHRHDGRFGPDRSDAELAVAFRGSKWRSC